MKETKGGKIMKQLKKDLQAVTKSLKQLTLKTEKIVKKLDNEANGVGPS